MRLGERTEAEIIEGFESTFNTFHKCVHDLNEDALVSKQEFFDYFTLLSATYQIDLNFHELMVECWNVDVKLMTTLPSGKNPAHELTNHRASWKYDFHRSHFGNLDHKVFEHNVEEAKKQSNKVEVSESMPAAGVRVWPHKSNSTTSSNVACLGGPKQTQTDVKQEDPAIKTFRDTLLSRGSRGIFGLRRTFQIADDDGSKSLNWSEFWKCLNDFRVRIQEYDAKALFNLFDAN